MAETSENVHKAAIKTCIHQYLGKEDEYLNAHKAEDIKKRVEHLKSRVFHPALFFLSYMIKFFAIKETYHCRFTEWYKSSNGHSGKGNGEIIFSEQFPESFSFNTFCIESFFSNKLGSIQKIIDAEFDNNTRKIRCYISKQGFSNIESVFNQLDPRIRELFTYLCRAEEEIATKELIGLESFSNPKNCTVSSVLPTQALTTKTDRGNCGDSKSNCDHSNKKLEAAFLYLSNDVCKGKIKIWLRSYSSCENEVYYRPFGVSSLVEERMFLNYIKRREIFKFKLRPVMSGYCPEDRDTLEIKLMERTLIDTFIKLPDGEKKFWLNQAASKVIIDNPAPEKFHPDMEIAVLNADPLIIRSISTLFDQCLRVNTVNPKLARFLYSCPPNMFGAYNSSKNESKFDQKSFDEFQTALETTNPMLCASDGQLLISTSARKLARRRINIDRALIESTISSAMHTTSETVAVTTTSTTLNRAVDTDTGDFEVVVSLCQHIM